MPYNLKPSFELPCFWSFTLALCNCRFWVLGMDGEGSCNRLGILCCRLRIATTSLWPPPLSVCWLVSWPVCWLVCRSFGRRSVIIFWKGGKLHFNALEFRSTCLLTEKLTKPFYFCRRIDEASQMPETTQEDSSFKRKLSKREKKALKKQVNI